MMRRPFSARLLAVVLAALLAFTGPGAAFAHGVAHVREHIGAVDHSADAHHGIEALQDGYDDETSASLDEPHDEAPASDAPADGHDHAQADAAVLKRSSLAAFLPSYAVIVAVARLVATTDASASAPPLERPVRLAGPPPASRAPPLV